MTHIKDGKLYICVEEPHKCEYCGKIDELRPYGKNGANICFECGMKDEKETRRQFRKRLKSLAN